MNSSTKPAGFWIRLVALTMDFLFIAFVVVVIASLVVARFPPHPHPPLTNGSHQIDPINLSILYYIGDHPGPFFWFWSFVFIFQWLYFAWQESLIAQATLGKRILGLKVSDLNGNRISFARATGRYFAKCLSLSIYSGGIMAAFMPKKQAMHDVMAGTLVVKG